MIHHSRYISSLSSPGVQLTDGMAEMEIDDPDATRAPTAGSSVPGSSGFNSQTTSATSPTSNPQTQPRKRSSSFRRHATLVIGNIPKVMAILPGIGEALEGINDGVQNCMTMSSNRKALVKLEDQIKSISAALKSEPRLLAKDPGYAHFTECIDNLHVSVQRELEGGLVRRFEAASKLDDFKTEFAELLAEAIKAGYLVQPSVVIPDEFDSTIPSLRIVNEANGLAIGELIAIRRYDGTPVDETRLQLHVDTYQAMYRDVPVEVEDYCGGPDDYLIQTLTELVDNYIQRGLNPILQQLHGGSVFKDQAGRLHAYLVLSPCEGTSWVKLVKAKQSIELLCQVAEKTATVFKQLKQNKQMNFDDIRVRPDGTLLLVPHTEGDHFLLDEDVFDPSGGGRDGEYEIGWPFEDLCRLLHESSKQGLVREAVAALREHDGTWDQIAVWRIARNIGLRPPPSSKIFDDYPPHHWTIDPGWIIHWPDSNSMLEQSDEYFNLVVRLPKSLMEEYERQHLKSFMIKNAMGKRGDECIDYFPDGIDANWLLPTQQEDWECLPLEPWQGVDSISLSYESVRLDMVGWEEWKHALKIVAQKKNLREEDLGVVTRTDVLVSIDKKDIPELGTRPIYFYRRKSGVDTTPQQFWGFFTFNQDPLGPTGLTVRRSGTKQWGRIVSESLPPDPPEYEPKWIDFEMCVPVLYLSLCSSSGGV
ncbi:hypothetical protein OPQ81_007234 [Rhizoctonia solani]|nr:hypothetical protein OPQ81_007234 [Rhizoctonia solani]